MHKQKLSVTLISDFNIDVLAGYLSNSAEEPAIDAVAGPFGLVVPVLLESASNNILKNQDCTLVWTRPESVIEEFAKALSFQEISIEKILEQVDQYAQALLCLRDQSTVTFVPSWVVPTYVRGYGVLDWKNNFGIANILAQMNLRLSQALATEPNFYVLNTSKWIESVGKDAFSEKLFYMGKIPFMHPVFKLAAQDIKAALRALRGQAKKLVIVDLDDTLWPGLVGNDGWQNLRLGGHDPIGEAFVAFQKALKSLTSRGILLGIVSKNDETAALEAIDNHSAMVLKREDFSGWRINWNDKAQNIVDLTQDLNLGLESVVFIDDSPFERARVREALPEVFVPEWPEDKTLYTQALLSLSCFDAPAFSREDSQRTQMYQAERQRRQVKTQVGSLDQWLATLEINIKIEELTQDNLVRATQLLNKTNQMNLSTRRLTESDLFGWCRQAENKMWAFSVSDKFGDSGLTGLMSLQIEENQGHIIDFVLSCRVFGRRVEETMIYTAFQFAKNLNLERLQASYVPTPKNSPCLDFFEKSGFQRQGNVFQWLLNREYAVPSHVTIKDLELNRKGA